MITNIAESINNMSALNVALLAFIPTISGVAAQIATYLPPPTKPGNYANVYKVVNWLGRNVGHAENK